MILKIYLEPIDVKHQGTEHEYQQGRKRVGEIIEWNKGGIKWTKV